MASQHIRNTLHILKRFLLIAAISLMTTVGSYGIITGRDLPLDPVRSYSTITGKNIVPLPCAAPSYDSSKPVLSETRGVPFNYHYYDPCHGNQILRDGFLLDFGFWIVAYAVVCFGLAAYRNARSSKHIN